MKALIDVGFLEARAVELEPLPTSVSQLIELIADADADVRAVVEVVKYDPAITVAVLRAANSAMSASVRQITAVEDAVVRLGYTTVAALAAGAAVSARMRGPVLDLAPGELWRHSVTAAIAVESLRRRLGPALPAATMTVALLHDVGKLVLAEVLRDPVTQAVVDLRAERDDPDARPWYELVDHAALGGFAARAWRLPEQVVEGIAAHHDTDGSMLSCAVQVADCLAHDVHGERVAHLGRAGGALEALGLRAEDYASLLELTTDRHETSAARFG